MNIYDMTGLKFKISPDIIVIIVDENEVHFRRNANEHILSIKDSEKENKLAKIIEKLYNNYVTINDLVNEFGEKYKSDIIDILNILFKYNILTLKYEDLDIIKDYGEIKNYIESKISISSFNFNNLINNIKKNHLFIIYGKGLILNQLIYNINIIGASKIKYIRTEKTEQVILEIERNIDKNKIIIGVYDYNNISTFIKLNEISIKYKIPLIIGYADGNTINFASFIPGKTACYYCMLQAMDANLGLSTSYVLYKLQFTSIKSPDRNIRSAITPLHANLAASLILLEALEILLNNSGFYSGKHFYININNLNMKLIKLLKNPRCPVCGKNRNISEPYIDILSFIDLNKVRSKNNI